MSKETLKNCIRFCYGQAVHQTSASLSVSEMADFCMKLNPRSIKDEMDYFSIRLTCVWLSQISFLSVMTNDQKHILCRMTSLKEEHVFVVTPCTQRL